MAFSFFWLNSFVATYVYVTLLAPSVSPLFPFQHAAFYACTALMLFFILRTYCKDPGESKQTHITHM